MTLAQGYERVNWTRFGERKNISGGRNHPTTLVPFCLLWAYTLNPEPPQQEFFWLPCALQRLPQGPPSQSLSLSALSKMLAPHPLQPLTLFLYFIFPPGYADSNIHEGQGV